MNWHAHHNRGEILRAVISTADERRDGLLPMDVEGVSETFRDDLDLLGALSLKWYPRLFGQIERALVDQPTDLEAAVVAGWHATADELPGLRLILDHYREHPTSPAMAEAVAKAADKERTMLAVMAGKAGSSDAGAPRAGALVEERARASYRPRALVDSVRESGHRAHRPRLIHRLRAALAA